MLVVTPVMLSDSTTEAFLINESKKAKRQILGKESSKLLG